MSGREYMSVRDGVGFDAARLELLVLAKAGSQDPKACRKLRKKWVDELRGVPALPAVRAEAIRDVRRSCGYCRGCKGV